MQEASTSIKQWIKSIELFEFSGHIGQATLNLLKSSLFYPLLSSDDLKVFQNHVKLLVVNIVMCQKKATQPLQNWDTKNR